MLSGGQNIVHSIMPFRHIHPEYPWYGTGPVFRRSHRRRSVPVLRDGPDALTSGWLHLPRTSLPEPSFFLNVALGFTRLPVEERSNCLGHKALILTAIDRAVVQAPLHLSSPAHMITTPKWQPAFCYPVVCDPYMIPMLVKWQFRIKHIRLHSSRGTVDVLDALLPNSS